MYFQTRIMCSLCHLLAPKHISQSRLDSAHQRMQVIKIIFNLLWRINENRNWKFVTSSVQETQVNLLKWPAVSKVNIDILQCIELVDNKGISENCLCFLFFTLKWGRCLLFVVLEFDVFLTMIS